MNTDDKDSDAKFTELFEGGQSRVLSGFRQPPEDLSKIAETKHDKARTRKAFETPERDQGGRDQGERRLPPGQARSSEWPVLDLGDKPVIAPEDWSLSVSGLVERPIKWDWQALMAQPQTELTTDIHCVTAWSRFDNLWNGVSARHLLSVIQPKAEARFLVFHGFDGYTTNVPLARFDADDVVLAHRWQGNVISRAHGGPVRVVIPSLYFWKSIKWLRHIAVLEHDVKGYWETRGYHNDGDPWKQQRYE